MAERMSGMPEISWKRTIWSNWRKMLDDVRFQMIYGMGNRGCILIQYTLYFLVNQF
jgi:hypothetical protein